MLTIKNWSRFQHFKDRRPPWVKLYRDLLDDIEWHELDAEAAKVLVSLWLIASESEGCLPESKELAFRLRISAKALESAISKLSHWLSHDDIKEISSGYQNDPLETEEETEKETVSTQSSDVTVVFECWKVTLDHPRAVLDKKRKKIIQDRLKDGYTSNDLCLAISGCSKSSFHMGENDKNQRYDSLDLILRDGSKVDSFIAIAGKNGNHPGWANDLAAGAV